MIEAVWLAFVGAVACTGWFAVCNDRTFRQRQKMIDAVRDHNLRMIAERRFRDLHDYPDDFVSYTDHLLHLFAFMDPRGAYLRRGWELQF